MRRGHFSRGSQYDGAEAQYDGATLDPAASEGGCGTLGPKITPLPSSPCTFMCHWASWALLTWLSTPDPAAGAAAPK